MSVGGSNISNKSSGLKAEFNTTQSKYGSLFEQKKGPARMNSVMPPVSIYEQDPWLFGMLGLGNQS